MKRRTRAIKRISAFLVFVLTISLFNMDGFNAFAEIRDSAMDGYTSISNALASLSLTSTQADCDHDYKVTNVVGTASCTKRTINTYTCSICGYSYKETKALGHLYKIKDTSYRKVQYKCGYCTSVVSKPVEEAMDLFETSINKHTFRGCDYMYADVVLDGIVNGKDYALLNQLYEYHLINPNADETTNQVYQYLCRINGNKTLTAQQESTWMGSVDYEINYIYKNTGKYPAMRGLDYMNDDFNGVNQRAIQWWNKGGLVTICWHTGSDFTGEWNDAMNDTVSNWDAMLTPGTTEYNNMIAGMDKAAAALKQLQDAGVTVLWRPFHEFDGGWFWWGKGTAENFKTMWKIMYDRYTNYWGLNNLIWVLGFSHNGVNYGQWNPGEDYYDIVGADSYDTTEYTSLYTKIKALAGNGKPICMHECGVNPTEAQLNDEMQWCYFMTWHTTYLTSDNNKNDLKALYNSERAITLDELSFR